jgi:hypothetical protein
VQVKLPGVLVQAALVSQFSAPVAHSSISETHNQVFHYQGKNG